MGVSFKFEILLRSSGKYYKQDICGRYPHKLVPLMNIWIIAILKWQWGPAYIEMMVIFYSYGICYLF
jgi:hypothetical protein